MAKYEPNSPQALAAAAKKAAKKFNTQLKQSPLYNAIQLGAPNQGKPRITQPAFGSDGKPLDPDNLPKEFFEPVVGKYGSYASGSGGSSNNREVPMVVTQPGMTMTPGSAGGSYASGPGLHRPGTGSTLVDQGLMSLTELGNKYADNEMIGGLVTGTYADIARTQANTGLALMYQDAMFESMGRYQGNLENLRVGNTSKLMAQEAALTGGLMGKQGEIQTQGLRVAGDEQRKGIRVTGEEQRKGIRVTGEEQRKGIRVTGEEQRKGIRVTGDENRKGIRETGSQERMNIDRRGVQNRLTLGEQGSQERMNIRERTQAQKNLRADARGAIRRSGARFFG